jgi:hypothetical protein
MSNIQFECKKLHEDSLYYMLTLEGFKKLGGLSMALHDLHKYPIFAQEVQSKEKLKECLTVENMTNWTKLTSLQSEKAKGKR